jgi:signal transduction histidine kinase
VAGVRNKHKAWILYFLSAVLAILVLLGTQDRHSEWFDSAAPKAAQGVMDLTGWSFSEHGNLKLNGEWEFYWEQLVKPEDFQQAAAGPAELAVLPGSWNKQLISGKAYPGLGYATYRLKLKLPQTGVTYALATPFITSAFKLWVNGELLSEVGGVGISSDTSTPRYSTKTVVFRPDTSETEIVLQISNFQHDRGGLRNPIELGLFESIHSHKEVSIIFDALLFGSLMIMGFYHLGLFTIRTNDPSTLYFGVFCILIALRTVLIGELILLKAFPDFPWELELKLEYITAYCGLAFFVLFIGELFPQESSRKVILMFIIVSVAYTVVTAVTPALVYSCFLLSFHIVIAIAIAVELYVLILAWIRRRKGVLIILLASLLFALTIINDMLYANEWISTTGRASGLGLLIFIISQSGVLSMKLSLAFANEERMSAALALANSNLNMKIKERTADLVAVNEELIVKNVELSRLEASRSHLISNISHDLGTPLTTIQCYVEAIMDGMVDTEEQRKQYMELIHGKVLGMGRLIEDLFQLSRLEARQVAFQLSVLTTERLIGRLYSRYQLDAQNAGVGYKLEICGQAVEENRYSQVEVDVERLQQVFSNLIHNSLKFTPEGGSIQVQMVDDHNGEMLCRISDTGAGISESDLPFIFDRFYTSNKSRNSVTGGRGLGLSISKEIIESHGGRIWVERSDLNGGTVLSFMIPAQTT